jgi:Zn-dependent peptidase ImmA (M78 family)
MRKPGIKVPARSKDGIHTIANNIRSVFQLDGPYVPVDNIYEILPELLPGFNFEIIPKEKMGGDEGKTYPGKKLIWIREDVYEGACTGSGRDRFTMAHELGHLFLHADVQLSRENTTAPAKIYMDSEWQADTFASGFLIDDKYLTTCRSLQDVSSMFGVTRSAANCRF